MTASFDTARKPASPDFFIKEKLKSTSWLAIAALSKNTEKVLSIHMDRQSNAANNFFYAD